MRQIAAKRHRDRLLQQIASFDMWKSLSLPQNFVAAICRTNSNWFEFVRQIKHKQPCHNICAHLQQVAATKFKSTNEGASINFPPC